MPVNAFRVTMFESAVPVSCLTCLEPLCLSAHFAVGAFRVTMFESAVLVSAFCVSMPGTGMRVSAFRVRAHFPSQCFELLRCFSSRVKPFFFFPAPSWTAEVSGSWTVLLGSLQAWTNTGGDFYPGGPGIVREMAKSKPELLNCWLGGAWNRCACQRISRQNVWNCCDASHFASYCFELLYLAAIFASLCFDLLCLSAHFASLCLELLRLSAHFASLVWNRCVSRHNV